MCLVYLHGNNTPQVLILGCRMLDRVKLKLQEMQTEFVNRRNVLFVSRKTRYKLAELQWEIMCRPLYLSDFSPADFYLFLICDTRTSNKKLMSNSRCPDISAPKQTIFKNEIHNLLNR